MRRSELSSKRLFMYLMAVSVVLVILPRRFSARLDQIVQTVVTPFSWSGRSLSVTIKENIDRVVEEPVPAQKYHQLEEKLRRERAHLHHTLQLLKQQHNLTRLFSGLRQQLGLEQARFIAAHVTGNDSSSLREINTLDRGAAACIRPGQIVLGYIGDRRDYEQDLPDDFDVFRRMAVVGKIIEDEDPGRWTARLQLLSDSNFNISVIIVPALERNQTWQEEGTLEGRGAGIIKVKWISSKKFPVQPGDVVLTSADPKTLPVEMVLGTVKQAVLDEENPAVWDITVKPIVDLHTMRQIIVIDNTPQTENP